MSEKKETSGRYSWNKSNKEIADDLIRLNKEIEENQKRINGLIELCDSLMDLLEICDTLEKKEREIILLALNFIKAVESD